MTSWSARAASPTSILACSCLRESHARPVRLLVDGYGAQQREVEIIAGQVTRLYVNMDIPPVGR